MSDKTTGKRLEVSQGRRGGPYLIVPFVQIAHVKSVLDAAKIGYWVDHSTLAINGGPAYTFVNFVKTTNRDEIQRELDRVA